MDSQLEQKIAAMSFEEAMKELETVVSKLETGNESLENAIANYEYGNLLRKFCEEKLNKAKLKVEKITQDIEGNFITEEVKID